MNTIRFSTKTEFINALEARRTFWRRWDDKQRKTHQQAEQEFLRRARAKMREALKLDYPALKKRLDYSGDLPLGPAPRECPRLQEARLDGILATLRLTSAKVFNVNQGVGAWQDAHYLLTADSNSPSTVC